MDSTVVGILVAMAAAITEVTVTAMVVTQDMEEMGEGTVGTEAADTEIGAVVAGISGEARFARHGALAVERPQTKKPRK